MKQSISPFYGLIKHLMKSNAEFYGTDKSKWPVSKITSFKIVMSSLFFLIYILQEKYEEKIMLKPTMFIPKAMSTIYSF